MFGILGANDPAALPKYFGVFEDFLSGTLTDNTAVAPSILFPPNTTSTYTTTTSNTYTTDNALAVGQGFSGIVSALNAGQFGFTAVSGGIITAPTQARPGGWVRITGAASSDNSGGSLQTRASYNFATGLSVSFKCRALLSNATEGDLLLGLCSPDVSVIAGITDGVYFLKADDGTTVACHIKSAQGSFSSTPDVPAAVFTLDTSPHVFSINVTPGGAANIESVVEFAIDGKVVWRAKTQVSASTVFLTPTVGFQSGTATGTIYAEVDYISAAQQR